MARFFKKFLPLLLFALLVSLLTACGEKTVREIDLGEGLPAWTLEEEYREEKAPEGYAKHFSPARDEAADIYLLSLPKGEGETLESRGQALAAEHQVFCNMISVEETPTDNISYADVEGGEPSIVRSYLFEGDKDFTELRFVYETEETAFGKDGMTISMIEGFREEEDPESIYENETVYTFEDPYLPFMRVRAFDKDSFVAEGASPEDFDLWAEDGWTLEEIIACYDAEYDLKKGEIIHRNGLDAAFVGYIEDGVFYVRAAIDCGGHYLMLCTENDVPHFQHVANALIDTIKAE